MLSLIYLKAANHLPLISYQLNRSQQLCLTRAVALKLDQTVVGWALAQQCSNA